MSGTREIETPKRVGLAADLKFSHEIFSESEKEVFVDIFYRNGLFHTFNKWCELLERQFLKQTQIT